MSPRVSGQSVGTKPRCSRARNVQVKAFPRYLEVIVTGGRIAGPVTPCQSGSAGWQALWQAELPR